MLEMWEQGRRGVAWLNLQSRGWLLVLLRAIQAVLAYQSSLMAAAIAYFTLFSVFPLTLMTVAIASLWFDPLPAESEIVKRLEFVVPALGRLLGANLEVIVRERGSVTLLSAVTLLWSSSTIFHVLTRALDTIWRVDRARPGWRHRGLAILTALSLSVLLFLASFLGSAVITIINQALPDQLRGIYGYLSNLSAVLVSCLLFAMLYYFLPHTNISSRDVLPGAIIAALLWELAKRAFLYFVSNYLSLSNLVYGSVATIVAFLTWAYVSSLIFLFGAHVNVQRKLLKAQQQVMAREK
ncbi:MAG: YihY/virulence factor BrkB family protein [Chloroflexi bacterium]|nr:YihY/virulence factor BrkB family protein [Chloroflexota bacterium]MCI0575868.1 YihY/virulence factor BrkB family protein [Chloroflexota bacterium]MCI0646595.1 YihY/virulence factor BrkB family protein [Chloroflexota bacterium]MCI0729611.1 YihY/virulence factor BrkB family protein [Chloroflexota bacterium]